MLLVSSCSCLYPIRWSQVLSWEWRCSWSSTDRRCSNYIWVINSLTAYQSASYIRDLTVPFIAPRGWDATYNEILMSLISTWYISHALNMARNPNISSMMNLNLHGSFRLCYYTKGKYLIVEIASYVYLNIVGLSCRFQSCITNGNNSLYIYISVYTNIEPGFDVSGIVFYQLDVFFHTVHVHLSDQQFIAYEGTPYIRGLIVCSTLMMFNIMLQISFSVYK